MCICIRVLRMFPQKCMLTLLGLVWVFFEGPQLHTRHLEAAASAQRQAEEAFLRVLSLTPSVSLCSSECAHIGSVLWGYSRLRRDLTTWGLYHGLLPARNLAGMGLDG